MLHVQPFRSLFWKCSFTHILVDEVNQICWTKRKVDFVHNNFDYKVRQCDYLRIFIMSLKYVN